MAPIYGDRPWNQSHIYTVSSILSRHEYARVVNVCVCNVFVLCLEKKYYTIDLDKRN